MNFHRNTNSDKRSTRVTHEAKAPSAGSTDGSGLLGSVFGRRSAAMPAVSRGPKGTGAPAAKLLGLLAISLIALFATAAPALADPPPPKMGAITNISYTSVEVAGEVTSDGSEPTAYGFQYSTDPTDPAKWVTGFGSAFGQGVVGADKPVPPDAPAQITGLKSGTKYFVRLVVNNGFFFGNGQPEVPSPAPYPSFTTLAADPPTIPGTVEASSVFSTTAEATAKVKRQVNSDDVNCHFEYITDAQYEANELASAPLFEGATPVDCAENPIDKADADAEPETRVTAPLAGLSPTTTYHLRLVAENSAPSGPVVKEAANFTTAAKVAAPTVTATDDASGVKYNFAEFTGKVLRPAGADPALDTNCHFDYVTDAQYEANELASEPLFEGATPVDCEQNTITADKVDAGGEISVSAKAALFPATTYHLRLVAGNEGGTDAKVAANTFTTPEAEKPVVTIDPVEGGTATTAHVTGTVTIADGHNGASEPFVQVSADGGATWSSFGAVWANSGGVFGNGTINGEGLFTVKADLTGLQPSTTYLFRIAASYNREFTNNPPQNIEIYEGLGEVAFSPAPNPSITTEPPQPPPTAEDLAVTGVTATSAHFSGTVNPNAPAGTLSAPGKKAFATHWEFVCTPECKDANGNVIGGTVQGEEGAQPVSGDARRLEANKHYEVKLVVKSEGGEETLVETFDTEQIPPSVNSTPGASDGKGGYTLQGVVNPNNQTITACEFRWGPNASAYAFSAPCSPTPGGGAKPTTVEAHLTGLTPGATYHADLVVTYGAGLEAEGGDQSFVPTLSPAEPCSNEQLRKENNSLALPECRAYEMVSPPGKEGWPARLGTFDGGVRVLYLSGAGNLFKSGQNVPAGDRYVAVRSAAGWETIPNLNGSSGSLYDLPSEVSTATSGVGILPEAYSSDLLSSLWQFAKIKTSGSGKELYLRNPDGTFTRVGRAGNPAQEYSGDLSHVVVGPLFSTNVSGPSTWGPGVYEFLGTSNPEQPRRVDLDNSGNPIPSCGYPLAHGIGDAHARSISTDGRVIVVEVSGGCGGANPPSNEVWARVEGTTSYDASASLCTRVDCNAPANATYQGAAKDGSRVYFTTTQQLVNGDTDETNDLYACDILTTPQAPVGKANPCSALHEVSAGSAGKADVQEVLSVSDDGSTAYFTAKGVLADNEDALKERAVAGDHNLYVWRQDSAHPNGQTTFVARLDSSTLGSPQTTPDGRYAVFTTSTPLVPADTDNAADVYRYDADTGELTRVSTNVSGVGGNGPFDAEISGAIEHQPAPAISDDGQAIVFTTAEALSPVDGNGEPDVYLWTRSRVSLIGAGASGYPLKLNDGAVASPTAAIDGSGQDVYFESAFPFSPADGDDIGDVYDARVGGGFSFAKAALCSGEACQSSLPASPSTAGSPANRPNGEGNVKPKTCPKGRVRKHGKCVKKPKRLSAKNHHGKKHHGKKGAHERGGGR